MSSTPAHRLDSAQSAWENLPLSGNLHPRFDDIANTGHPNSITRLDNGEGNALDASVPAHQLRQLAIIDFKNAPLIAKRPPKT